MFSLRRALISSPVATSATAIALALLLAGSFQPHYVAMLLRDTDPLKRQMESMRYGKLTEFRPFIEEVDRIVPIGESVALVLPWQRWEGGHAYAYYRASYALAGRDVLPLVMPDDQPAPQHLFSADWVAGWRVALSPDGYDIVWSGHEGVVAKVRR